MSGNYESGLQDIETYINSIDDDQHKTDLKNAKDLYRYLSNNIDGLPRWQDQLRKWVLICRLLKDRYTKTWVCKRTRTVALSLIG